jgi:hypothetical protein
MADEPAIRDKSGKFVKGISGNPSGRKPIPQEFKDLAEEYSVVALRKVIAIINNPTSEPKDIIKGSELIISYGIGKPKQPVDVTSDDQPLQVIFNIPRPSKDDTE